MRFHRAKVFTRSQSELCNILAQGSLLRKLTVNFVNRKNLLSVTADHGHWLHIYPAKGHERVNSPSRLQFTARRPCIRFVSRSRSSIVTWSHNGLHGRDKTRNPGRFQRETIFFVLKCWSVHDMYSRYPSTFLYVTVWTGSNVKKRLTKNSLKELCCQPRPCPWA
jgi:hypothetical protein